MSFLSKLVTAVVIGFSGLAAFGQPPTNDVLTQFSAELKFIEDQQALQPDRPIKYNDPITGVALKKLLNPMRAHAVWDAYYATRQSNITDPDGLELRLMLVLLSPAVVFDKGDKDYENETIDGVLWLAANADALFRDSKNRAADLQEVRMIVEINRIIAPNVSFAEKLRADVVKGKFTQAGSKRALDIANQISPIPAAK